MARKKIMIDPETSLLLRIAAIEGNKANNLRRLMYIRNWTKLIKDQAKVIADKEGLHWSGNLNDIHRLSDDILRLAEEITNDLKGEKT